MQHRGGNQQILVYPDIKWAVGTFSITDPECARIIAAVAEEEASPVGMCIDSDVVESGSIPGLAREAMAIAERSAVPVEVIFANMRSLSVLRLALDLGFSTGMFDGSFLPFSGNMEMTARAVETAHRAGVTIEGKIGAFGDFGKDPSGQCFIISLAQRFSKETGVDSLVISIPFTGGEAYRLNLDLLGRIRKGIRGGLSLDDAARLAPADIPGAVATGVTRLSFSFPRWRPAGEARLHSWMGETVRQKLQLLGAAGPAAPSLVPEGEDREVVLTSTE